MFFYDECTVAEAENEALVVGTKKPETEGNIIDTLIVPDYDKDTLSEVESLLNEYDIDTVYIPDEEELYRLCSGFDVATVKVEGSMSFGIGGASVTVTAGEKDTSLITRLSIGKERMLLCGSMDKTRFEELKSIDNDSFAYICLTAAQKDIAEDILSTYTPKSLIFKGIDPYIEGYDIIKDSVTLKE
ncbi:MAG: hypothetical protein IJA55_04650 [Clostridia bacterium]|nr:hypothetical protein [Clostridia bacterium]